MQFSEETKAKVAAAKSFIECIIFISFCNDYNRKIFYEKGLRRNLKGALRLIIKNNGKFGIAIIGIRILQK